MTSLPVRKPTTRVLNAVCKQPWAITEDWLHTILDVALRENPTIEAVEAQIGKPLDNTHDVTVREGVATIPVDGPLFRYADMFTKVSGATCIETLATDLDAALADPKITGIVFYIDSPGGEVNGTNEFADMIYAARGRKPLIAYVADYACSAAYWIASATDEVVVADTAILGSIGVVAAVPDPNVKTSKEIEFVSSQSPNKRTDPTTESGKEQIQAIVDDLADVFVTSVARNRDISPSDVLSDFGQGGVFVGQKAVAAGLADRVGSYESVLAQLAQSHKAPIFGQRVAATAMPANQTDETTPRRVTVKFLDYWTKKATEDGVEIDRDEIAAAERALSGAPSEEETTLQAELQRSNARVALLEEAEKRHADQLARAADERRQHEAEAYVSRLLASHKITPTSAEALMPLVARISALDEGTEKSEGQAGAGDLLRTFADSLTDLSVFTTENIRNGEAAALFNVATTPGVDGKEEADAERVKKMLAATPIGRRVLAEDAKNGK